MILIIEITFDHACSGCICETHNVLGHDREACGGHSDSTRGRRHPCVIEHIPQHEEAAEPAADEIDKRSTQWRGASCMMRNPWDHKAEHQRPTIHV